MFEGCICKDDVEQRGRLMCDEQALGMDQSRTLEEGTGRGRSATLVKVLLGDTHLIEMGARRKQRTPTPNAVRSVVGTNDVDVVGSVCPAEPMSNTTARSPIAM